MTTAKSDPLLAALIRKLPPAGESFSAEQQFGWLRLMAMAFNLVYGGDVAARLERDGLTPAAPRQDAPPAGRKWRFVEPARPAAHQPAAPAAPAQGYAFYVDEDGYARRRGGARVLASEVTDTLYDLRGGLSDLSDIVWADDQVGLKAAELVVAAA